jgi:hypothetical protein
MERGKGQYPRHADSKRRMWLFGGEGHGPLKPGCRGPNR